jgi:iron complex outermembrane receptor protein
MRYQPTKALLFRGSANSGFRAPTLYELNRPLVLSATLGAFDDPVLCPNGTVAPGGNAARDCAQQFNRRFGGNKNLEPEKSRTYSFGTVLQPLPSLSVSLDYWDIVLKNQIDGLAVDAIFADPAKYSSKFVRCGQLTAAEASAIPVCVAGGVFDPAALAFVDVPNENLGEIKTKGFDFGLIYRSRLWSFGRFTLTYDGTYVQSYQSQREKGGEYIDRVGRRVDSQAIFRWQHVTSVNWTYQAWSSTLTNRLKSGYVDENNPAELIGPEFNNYVGQYSLWDLTVTWNGIKNLSLTAGVKNLFDKDPPYSNQSGAQQANYDPAYTDPRGRTFLLRATYSFK